MTRFEQVTSFIIMGLGGVAVVGGLLAWSVPAFVLGALLILAALWFRKSLVMMVTLKENTDQLVENTDRMEESLGILARAQHRETARADDADLVRK